MDEASPEWWVLPVTPTGGPALPAPGSCQQHPLFLCHMWGGGGRGGGEGAREGPVQRREHGGERARGGPSSTTVASFGGPPAVRQVHTPGQGGGIHLCLRDGGVKAWR